MGCIASDQHDGYGTQETSRSLKPNPAEVDLSHFNLLGVLGQGGFGIVRECTKLSGLDSGKFYAIKCLSKKNVLRRSNGPTSVLMELEILAMLDSPFICNSHYAFQSPTTLFLVLDLARGGDMRFNMKCNPKNRFSESVSKFYISQLMLALDCCHSLNILHRDVKPENLVMKSNGYIMLTDFGIAKILPDIEDCRGTSGTHGYMVKIKTSDPNSILTAH